MKRCALLALMVLTACGTRTRPSTLGVTQSAGVSSSPPPLAPEAQACIDAPTIEAGQTARGTTSGRRDLFHGSCGFGAASPDAVYRFHVAAPSHVVVRLQGGYDTVLYVRSACGNDDTEIVCNDDAPDDHHSAIEADFVPGDYYAVVDGYDAHNAGFYSLSVNMTPAPAARPPARFTQLAPGDGATIERTQGGTGVNGHVLFAKRTVTPHGLTRATTDMPAPHFVIEAIKADGTTVATTESDDAGAFHVDLPAGLTVRVRALTRTTYLGNDIRVVTDPGTERPYEISTQPFRIAGGENITLHAGTGGIEPAGAFNILAQFVRALPFVERGFGRALPPLFAFWRRGNNQSLPQGRITAFLLEYHRHEGTYALQIQGGDAGHEDESDSDQFDDPVILHEFTHFVVHTLAGHYSIGGLHRNGELHFPAQALDEGAASAIGCSVTGDSRYWDTAGLEPTGQILVDEDSESMALPDRGIGSQNSAQTIMWDLADGAEGITDRDNDGVAIGLSGVMRIYASFREDPVAFPGIHTVLERAVQLNLVTPAQATRLVHQPVNQGFAFPVAPRDEWPADVVLPGDVQGVIDGRTQPAPSGGRNVPMNGLDAIRTYRMRIEHRGMVYVDLAIQGPGTQASGTDLDLQLVTRTLRPIGRSASETPEEHIHLIVDPGTYIVLVRDGDTSDSLLHVGTSGNRAAYALRVRQSNEFH